MFALTTCILHYSGDASYSNKARKGEGIKIGKESKIDFICSPKESKDQKQNQNPMKQTISY